MAKLTKPSKRHPAGVRRCSRWEDEATAKAKDRKGIVNGIWQCPKAAREGFPVCGTHGAGYPKREKTGARENPKLAGVTTGASADAETIRQLYAQHPEFQALYHQQLDNVELLNFREELALARALARFFVDQAAIGDTDNSFGKTPPALMAIDRLEKVMAMGERCLKIEAGLGPITHEQLRHYFAVVADTLERFIPSSKHVEARNYLTRRLRERDLAGVELDFSSAEQGV